MWKTYEQYKYLLQNTVPEFKKCLNKILAFRVLPKNKNFEKSWRL